jgi:hypothetical protein
MARRARPLWPSSRGGEHRGMEALLIVPPSAAYVLFFVLAISLAVRAAKGAGPRAAAFVEAMKAAGASGDERPLTLSLVLRRPERTFELTASHHGKGGVPGHLWLGTSVREVRRKSDGPCLERLPHAVFVAEASLHRLGKLLGLERELELGERAFDERVYVETSRADEPLLRELLRAPEVAARVASLVGPGRAVVLNAEGHALALRLDNQGPPEDLLALVPQLDALAAVIPPVLGVELRDKHRPSAALVLVVLFVSVGAAVGLIVANETYLPLGSAGVGLAGALSALLFALSIGGAWLLSRGRPRGLTRFLVASLVSLAAAPPLATTGVVLTNALLDDSLEEHPVRVVSSRSQRSGKSTLYYLTLEGWPEPGPREVRVRSPVYKAMAWRKAGVVKVGKGALGYPWLRDIVPVAPTPTPP